MCKFQKAEQSQVVQILIGVSLDSQVSSGFSDADGVGRDGEKSHAGLLHHWGFS